MALFEGRAEWSLLNRLGEFNNDCGMNDGIIEEIRTLSRQFSDRVRNSGVSQSCAATRAMDNFAAGTFVSNVKLLNVVD